MKNFTEEQIAQMYDNLPEDLKDVIFGLEMNEIVERIGRENQLNIEQIGDLANETGMVMLGVTHPNEFIANLAERLEVDKRKSPGDSPRNKRADFQKSAGIAPKDS